MNEIENEIVNPCISVCRTDPISGYCYGCGRSEDDKSNWRSLETSNEWKNNNLQTLRKRLSGWQQDAFNKSYQSKIDTGITLIKKKLMNSKKK